ncbi:ABC1 family protein [Toxoplasma gondii ME49]|uniref:ABC1 family protein n=1 Tax=Toxoplasma gondii (strain ATCC 50611 / Me49) TaxID=508771 RepID=S8FC30_TOXGM|nr:ABC1 family protein [Toxoplasma gondii ME49]EPT31243.1 ABC1 family protein [Toxoplasma gondii ME49]|eukprot:XP_018637896.1 ABC1 family protein [Toxoplasma gondii ME49]
MPAFSCWRSRDTPHEEGGRARSSENTMSLVHKMMLRCFRRRLSVGHTPAGVAPSLPANQPERRHEKGEEFTRFFSFPHTVGLPRCAWDVGSPPLVSCPLLETSACTYMTVRPKPRRKGRTRLSFSPSSRVSFFLPPFSRARSRIDPQSSFTAGQSDAKLPLPLCPPSALSKTSNAHSSSSSGDASWATALALAVCGCAIPEDDARDAGGVQEFPFVFSEGELEEDADPDDFWRVSAVIQSEPASARNAPEGSGRPRSPASLSFVSNATPRDITGGEAEEMGEAEKDDVEDKPEGGNKDEAEWKQTQSRGRFALQSVSEQCSCQHRPQFGEHLQRDEDPRRQRAETVVGGGHSKRGSLLAKRVLQEYRIDRHVGLERDPSLPIHRPHQNGPQPGTETPTGNRADPLDQATDPQRDAANLFTSLCVRPCVMALKGRSPSAPQAWWRQPLASSSLSSSAPAFCESATPPVLDRDREHRTTASLADYDSTYTPSAGGNQVPHSSSLVDRDGMSSEVIQPEKNGGELGDRRPKERERDKHTLSQRMTDLVLLFKTPLFMATPEDLDMREGEKGPAGLGSVTLRATQVLTRQLEELAQVTNQLVSWLRPTFPDSWTCRGALSAVDERRPTEAEGVDSYVETVFRTRAAVVRFVRSMFYLMVAAADYKLTFSRVDRVSRQLIALREERERVRERLGARETQAREANTSVASLRGLAISEAKSEKALLQKAGGDAGQSELIGINTESARDASGSLLTGGGRCALPASSLVSSTEQTLSLICETESQTTRPGGDSSNSWSASAINPYVDASSHPPRDSMATRLGELAAEIEALINTRKELLSCVHDRCARRLLHVCRCHGGLYTKLGQYVATMTHIIPAAYTEHLRTLHDDAARTPWPLVARLVATELGAPIEDVFLFFNQEAVAAASLAQVHHARLRDGREVAVKVQRPRLREQMHGDLKTVEIMMHLVSWAFPDFEFRWLLPEFRQNMRQETDFRQEAYNAMRLRWLFRHQSEVYVPWVDWERTTERVMTMEFVRGLKVTDTPEALERELGVKQEDIARLVMRVFADMIFVHGFVHCDPHPGNLFVRVMPDDGEVQGEGASSGITRYHSPSARHLAELPSIARQFLIMSSVKPVAPTENMGESGERRDRGKNGELGDGVSGVHAVQGKDRRHKMEPNESHFAIARDQHINSQLSPCTLAPNAKRGRRRLQLVIIDHGTYCRLKPSFRSAYSQLWKALLLNDIEEGRKACRALGARLVVSPDWKRSSALAGGRSVPGEEVSGGHESGHACGDREANVRVKDWSGLEVNPERESNTECSAVASRKGGPTRKEMRASRTHRISFEASGITVRSPICEMGLPGDESAQSHSDASGCSQIHQLPFPLTKDYTAQRRPRKHNYITNGGVATPGVPDPDEDAALDLLSLILTYRPQTRLLYTALGSAIHVEDRKAMITQLRGTSFSAVNAFLESLPRDLLWVLRMTNILRSLNLQLGGFTRSRFLAMGESCCRGLQLSNELVDEMEADCRRFLSVRKEEANGSLVQTRRRASAEVGGNEWGNGKGGKWAAEAGATIHQAEENTDLRERGGSTLPRAASEKASTGTRELVLGQKNADGEAFERIEAVARTRGRTGIETKTPTRSIEEDSGGEGAGTGEAKNGEKREAPKKPRALDGVAESTTEGIEELGGAHSESVRQRSVPKWYTLPGAESLNLPLASDMPCFAPTGSVMAVCRALDILVGPVVWLAETLSGRSRLGEARDTHRGENPTEMETSKTVWRGLKATVHTRRREAGEDPLEKIESQILECNERQAPTGDGGIHSEKDSSACSRPNDFPPPVAFSSLSPWSARVARTLLKAVLSLQLWWSLQCLRVRLWLADAFLALAVAQLPAGDVTFEQAGGAISSESVWNRRVPALRQDLSSGEARRWFRTE